MMMTDLLAADFLIEPFYQPGLLNLVNSTLFLYIGILQGVALLLMFFIFQILKNPEMEDKLMEEQENKYTLVAKKSGLP